VESFEKGILVRSFHQLFSTTYRISAGCINYNFLTPSGEKDHNCAYLMQLKILEDFVALAKTRSFTAAARSRNVTHPAFGRRIKALEEWLGSALVDRKQSHGALKLTEAGEAFLVTATRTLSDLAKAKLTVSSSQREEIRICTGRTLARTLAADWVTWFGRRLVTRGLGLSAKPPSHRRQSPTGDSI
jgi:Bacterial regulatory helix-turn-helix protein, lysR family